MKYAIFHLRLSNTTLTLTPIYDPDSEENMWSNTVFEGYIAGVYKTLGSKQDNQQA